MPSDGKKPIVSRPDSDREPATPAAERRPGESARTDNTVKARDPFGAPRPETEWTREAITTKTVRPSFGGNSDKVTDEQAEKLKG